MTLSLEPTHSYGPEKSIPKIHDSRDESPLAGQIPREFDTRPCVVAAVGAGTLASLQLPRLRAPFRNTGRDSTSSAYNRSNVSRQAPHTGQKAQEPCWITWVFTKLITSGGFRWVFPWEYIPSYRISAIKNTVERLPVPLEVERSAAISRRMIPRSKSRAPGCSVMIDWAVRRFNKSGTY